MYGRIGNPSLTTTAVAKTATQQPAENASPTQILSGDSIPYLINYCTTDS